MAGKRKREMTQEEIKEMLDNDSFFKELVEISTVYSTGLKYQETAFQMLADIVYNTLQEGEEDGL